MPGRAPDDLGQGRGRDGDAHAALRRARQEGEHATIAAKRFVELSDMAIRTATAERFGLVLLRLPVPELPAIYDRPTGHLTTWNFAGEGGGYLDNLALTDRFVGALPG